MTIKNNRSLNHLNNILYYRMHQCDEFFENIETFNYKNVLNNEYKLISTQELCELKSLEFKTRKLDENEDIILRVDDERVEIDRIIDANNNAIDALKEEDLKKIDRDSRKNAVLTRLKFVYNNYISELLYSELLNDKNNINKLLGSYLNKKTLWNEMKKDLQSFWKEELINVYRSESFNKTESFISILDKFSKDSEFNMDGNYAFIYLL